MNAREDDIVKLPEGHILRECDMFAFTGRGFLCPVPHNSYMYGKRTGPDLIGYCRRSDYPVTPTVNVLKEWAVRFVSTAYGAYDGLDQRTQLEALRTVAWGLMQEYCVNNPDAFRRVMEDTDGDDA